jgi:hypothetical protein
MAAQFQKKHGFDGAPVQMAMMFIMGTLEKIQERNK